MSAWNELESALRKGKPEELKKLNGSISSDQMKKLEALLDGNKLPTAYSALLHKHDGSKDWDDAFSVSYWQFLSSEKILVQHAHLKETLGGKDSGSDGNVKIKGVQDVMHDPLWIPIFMSEDGKEFACLDFNPGAGGTKGQVINVHVQRGPMDNLKSFDEFMSAAVEESLEELEDELSTESLAPQRITKDAIGKMFLASEAINYQDTKTFKELELAFRDMMYEQTQSQFLEQKRQNEIVIESIIRNSFNANISVNFGDEYPCVQIFDEYHNSVLVRNDYREFYASQLNFTKRFIAQGSSKKAGVNIMTAKLSGLFSELPATIYMPLTHLVSGYADFPQKFRFTPEEMAAVMLHEIGHFFTYCETFSRTVTTNMALATMSKELDGTISVSQREVIIARTADDLNLKDVDIKAIASTDKKSIIETAIVCEIVEKSRTELGISIYDSTASEFLADQFAARHGAGRHLMTALNKFVGLFGPEYAHMSQPVFIFRQLISIALMFIPPICILLVPLNILGILMGGCGDDGDNTYDTPEVRFRRIKHDAIGRLKNRYVSAEEKKRVLADIDAMDKAMEGIKDKREWREYLATTLIPVYRRHRKSKMLQQQLEQLGNNPLFVRSAELATLL